LAVRSCLARKLAIPPYLAVRDQGEANVEQEENVKGIGSKPCIA
jgi:hypothetical protein